MIVSTIDSFPFGFLPTSMSSVDRYWQASALDTRCFVISRKIISLPRSPKEKLHKFRLHAQKD